MDTGRLPHLDNISIDMIVAQSLDTISIIDGHGWINFAQPDSVKVDDWIKFEQ